MYEAAPHALANGGDALDKHKAAYRLAFFSFVKKLRHFSPKFLALYQISQTVSTRHVASYESTLPSRVSTVSTDNAPSSSATTAAASVPIHTLSKHLSPIDLIRGAWSEGQLSSPMTDGCSGDMDRERVLALIRELYGQPLESPSVIKEALRTALSAKLSSPASFANGQRHVASNTVSLHKWYITDVHLKWLIKTAGLWPTLASCMQLMDQARPLPVHALGRSNSMWSTLSGIVRSFLQTLGTSYEEYTTPQLTATEVRSKLQSSMQLPLSSYLSSHHIQTNPATPTASNQLKNGVSISNPTKEPVTSLTEIAVLWDILLLYTHTEYDNITGSWRSGDGGLGQATVGYLNEKMDVARAALQSLKSFLKGLPSLVIRPTAVSQSDAVDDGEKRYMSLLLQYCSVPPPLANEAAILVDHLSLDIIPAVEPYLTGLSATATATATEYDNSNSLSQPQLLPADTVKLVDTLYHRLVRTRNELTCVLGTVVIERMLSSIVAYIQRCILMMYASCVHRTDVQVDAESYASNVHLCTRYVIVYIHSTYLML